MIFSEPSDSAVITRQGLENHMVKHSDGAHYTAEKKNKDHTQKNRTDTNYGKCAANKLLAEEEYGQENGETDILF